METAPTTAAPSDSSAATPGQDDAERRTVADQARSQALARALESRTPPSPESRHQQLRDGLERIYASPAGAAEAEAALVRHAEKRGIAATLDRFMRKPERFGRLTLDRDAAREAARSLAPEASAVLIERSTRAARPSAPTGQRSELTPAQVRHAREEHVLRAAARDRLRAAAARRWGPGAGGEHSNLLPGGRNVRETNPNGTVREYLADEVPPRRTIHPYSDVATRTTFTADRRGIPRLVPAEQAQTAAELRPAEVPVRQRRVELPFDSPPARLPGEPARGLRGRSIPYPVRPSGRPQAQRFHTCVACSYAKFSAHARNYDLCKDCHRVLGLIPRELFKGMIDEAKRRGLVERRAESFGHTRSFSEVAQALARRWRAEHLQFGTSAGEPYILYPQSDVATRRTLAADAHGGPLAAPRPDMDPRPPHPYFVPAAQAFDRELHPVLGVFPTARAEPIDLAAEIGEGLARSEDELMISGDRSARSDHSPYEVEPDLMDGGRLSRTARLSDFTDQRPIEINKASGLTKEEIFALSDAVDHGPPAGRGRGEPLPSPGEAASPARADEERDNVRRAVARHNRGHADPVFFAGPSGDDVTSHVLAGALTQAQKEAAWLASYERDRAEANHENAAWERRRKRLGIRDSWRSHSDWSGPFREITPPEFNKAFAGPTGVDESLEPGEVNAFLADHRKELISWLCDEHDARVKSWLAGRGITAPHTARAVALALREGDEERVVAWLESKGVSPQTYEQDRAWLDEPNPATFERRLPLNSAAHAIGDLTPELAINARIASREAAHATEERNWSRHGGALSRSEARAVLEEYRSATAAPQGPAIPLTSGTTAAGRGDTEGPRDAANARARLDGAATQFKQSVARTFANPDAFLRLFHTASPGDRSRLLLMMETRPGKLASTFGPATRFRGLNPLTRAVEAAQDGRAYLEARRDLRRSVRTVAASAGVADHLHVRRVEFRAATQGLFQDPAAFHRVFDGARLSEKRMLLAALAADPGSLETRIGAAGRVASAPRVTDPRWAPLTEEVHRDALERARSAAVSGRGYVSALVRHTGQVRAALLAGRTEARSTAIAAVAKHFPEARAIDAHARLSAEMEGLGAEITRWTRMAAQLDRSFNGLVTSASELREQLRAVVADPQVFVHELKKLTAAEKHRVFDLMVQNPAELAKLPQFGPAARLTGEAPRYTALVAVHGRHYVDGSLKYRDLVADSGRVLGLPASAGRWQIDAALAGRVEALEGRVSRLEAERATLPVPDLARAAAQWRTLDDAERIHLSRAYPDLARAMDRVEAARGVGASVIGRQKRTTALKEHSGQHRARNKSVAGLEL
jgi:hypothetical protein